MDGSDSLLLVLAVSAALGWCGYVWWKRGATAWRRALLGVFLIASTGGAASASLHQRPLIEVVVVAVTYGVLASVILGAIYFNVWIRAKGEERRSSGEGRRRSD